MNIKLRQRIIEFYSSPILLVTAAPAVVIGTSRLAYSIISAASLLWVYALSVFIVHISKKTFPKGFFFNFISLFLFSFVASLFFLLLEICNPLLAMEVFLLVFISPVICFASDIESRTESLTLAEALIGAVSEALLIGIFLIALSIVREPLGFGSLSIPGGAKGIIEFFNIEEDAFPIQIISSSGGALFLLGYILFIVRLIKPKKREEQS